MRGKLSCGSPGARRLLCCCWIVAYATTWRIDARRHRRHPHPCPGSPPPGPSASPVRSAPSRTAPRGFEGEGFPVRRAFAGVDLADLDPFIHMDQMGEVDYAPGEPRGTDWHPHRGFETVTYIIDGTFQHQDSHGGGGVISNGATQWMTAGGGILHIETPPEELVVSGGLFHGIQLWVNLPAKDKMVAPRYQNLEADLVTLLSSPDGGALVRLIAGDIGGHAGPGSTHTPITVAHATVAPGAQLVLPWRADFNALAYVLSGAGTRRRRGRPDRRRAAGAVRRRRHAHASTPTAPSRSTSSCSAGSRSASRSPPTARS